MKVPAEIRQMWTDAYNLLVEIYKDDEALTKDAESFFGPLADRIQAEANAHHHSHASDLLLACLRSSRAAVEGETQCSSVKRQH